MNQTGIKTAKHVHLTGIKGVGMTAAALCLQDLTIPVSGSDIDQEFVTAQVLKQRQIPVTTGFSPDDIPAATTHVVFTGAHLGSQNPQVQAALKRGLTVISHAQAVGELMAGKTAISVCGVGGKTSISAMIANILDYANYKPSFLIGVGRVLNLQVPGRMSSGPHFIAEADEYVVSPGSDPTPRFMYHTPNVIVCTNIAHDHPDAYPSLTETKVAFQAFFDKLRATPGGLLVVNGNSGPARQLNYENMPVLFYGATPHNNAWWVKETFVGQGKQMVTFVSKEGEEVKASLIVPGQFNALNALASFIVARHLGVKDDIALQALQLFRGSMRRFEKVGEKDGVVYYDDYAHHPSQILATLRAAKQWLPLNKIITVFQPHTYSRTKALLPQFAKSFTYADKVIITDIYASAREKPDPEISAYRLVEEIKHYHSNVIFVPFNDLISHLRSTLQNQDALFTMGAGNIYVLHQQLLS